MNSTLNISEATKKNWKRLNVTKGEMAGKLSKRANKILSEKHIIPVEYFNNKKNLKNLKKLLTLIYSLNLPVENVIYNLAINYLKMHNLAGIENYEIVCNNKNIKKILSEIKQNTLNSELINFQLPNDEIDILGIIYQSLMSEGNKNKKGSYYTPKKIINHFLPQIGEDTVLLDPCCGTGSFLLNLSKKIKNPMNIHGVDLDKISSFISKINLVVMYKDIDFYPNIYNQDFLENNTIERLKDKKINFIATNPPWGKKYGKDYTSAFPQILSKEIFSYFIVQSKKILSKDGTCCFILPESILNVNMHKDIRKFILDNYSIEEIKTWGKAFNGVLTDTVSVKLTNNNRQKIKILFNNISEEIDKSVFEQNNDFFFNLTSNQNIEITDYIYSLPHETLKESIWGLGIVTGNNKKHIKDNLTNGEKIYEGKNITQYNIKNSDKYILYKKENFQQTAPDSIYRAKEKLVYKFISKKLVFAYDNEQKLFLNSANILIPKLRTHSIKTAMALLNSNVFNFIYKNKFNALKILKGNLIQLPFPELSDYQRKELEILVNNYIKNKDKATLDIIENTTYNLFKLPPAYIKIIENNQ